MMKKKKPPKPTESELEVLQVIWQHGPSTVRFVNEILNKNKRVGYTTTLKIMQIMAGKGILVRNVDERSHVYEASVPESETQQWLLDRFLNSAFGGSAKKLVLQALGNYKATAGELEEIRKLIESIERQRS